MVGADSSSLVAYLKGEAGVDVDAVEAAITNDTLRLPPPVVTEMLSNPDTARAAQSVIAPLPLIEIGLGYWERAGVMRALLLRKGLKARIADVLIAQACIDADVPLITRDRDYRHFAQHCGLKLA